MVYNNYENVTIKLPEIEQYMPKIDTYFVELQRNIEEYILKDIQVSFYRAYFDSIQQIYNTLDTTGGNILNKYKNATHDTDVYKRNLEGDKNEIINYIKYIDSLYKNNKDVMEYMNLIVDQRDKALLYLVNRYGIADDLVVIIFKIGKRN
jgi:hypothetical protein